ncbi:hypothetical protein CesoFtcFv8_012412 [Champsocephalus esox]|uniref:Uncharacterized protein n=1 Tax=Champsocephalus esox TaxID=159716 RepID=A0AAN8BVT0_9TELE|nr:hypothetical protein CesoFtcFv8_012412 [Champsocephalus esox]
MRSMPEEEVAMFLTSNPHLLNSTEKQAWRRAWIRPLRRSIPVRGINKPTEGRKHHVCSVEERVGVYMDKNRLYLRLSSN